MASRSKEAAPGASEDGTAAGIGAAVEGGAHFSSKWRFWVIMVGLATASLLVALEGTVVSTALPSIVRDLHGGQLYVWVVNGYFLTCTAVLPLYGQLANILGRRYLMLSAITIFLLGTGLCGGSTSMAMLIAGRAVQGMGGGGLTVMIDLIICDLVPLRERGNVMGLVFAVATIGTSLGPFMGGILVQQASWRWVFWINLPIGALPLLLLSFFLHMHYERSTSVRARLQRIDIIGNGIFVLSVIAIQIPLANAGTVQSWAAWETLVPLMLGLLGLGAFIVFEWSSWCAEPSIPHRLFCNRTSVAALGLTFVATFLLYWVVYFLPVYFQSVMRASPTLSGVRTLPLVVLLPVSGLLGGMAMARLNRYRGIHAACFALMALALGLFTRLAADSPIALWLCVQMVFAVGNGPTMSTLLPAVQAPLQESDAAVATGTWAVMRNLGTVCAIAISTALFNSRSAVLASDISDPAIAAQFEDGHAYELATAAFVGGLDAAVQAEVLGVYTRSLLLLWIVAAAVAGMGLFLCFVERDVSLRHELDTQFGLDEN